MKTEIDYARLANEIRRQEIARRRGRGWNRLAIALTIVVGLAGLVLATLNLLEWYMVLTTPIAPPPAIPTAYVAPAPVQRPVYQPAPAIPTLAPGLAAEIDSEAIYLATAEAMEAPPVALPGVSEHGSKPSIKVWPTPAPAIEVQVAPAPFGTKAAPTEQPQHGSKPSKKTR